MMTVVRRTRTMRRTVQHRPAEPRRAAAPRRTCALLLWRASVALLWRAAGAVSWRRGIREMPAARRLGQQETPSGRRRACTARCARGGTPRRRRFSVCSPCAPRPSQLAAAAAAPATNAADRRCQSRCGAAGTLRGAPTGRDRDRSHAHSAATHSRVLWRRQGRCSATPAGPMWLGHVGHARRARARQLAVPRVAKGVPRALRQAAATSSSRLQSKHPLPFWGYRRHTQAHTATHSVSALLSASATQFTMTTATMVVGSECRARGRGTHQVLFTATEPAGDASFAQQCEGF